MTEATLARTRPQIDDPEELGRIVRWLVEAFEPVAIYLFGSRSRGDASDHSNYDLMLVLADDNERVRARQEVWQTARSRSVPSTQWMRNTRLPVSAFTASHTAS